MIPRHDFHMHTHYSDGESSPSEMLEAGIEREMKAIAITDHGPEHSVGIDSGQIGQMISDVKRVKSDADIPVLVGMEANVIGIDGKIDLKKPTLDQLDIVLAGVHYLSTPEVSPERIARDYHETGINAMERGEIDVLAHPYWYWEDLTSHLSREDFEEFAEVAVESGVAIEISESYRTPPREILPIFKKEGLKFSLGSDSHVLEKVGKLSWARGALEEVGVSREDLVLEGIA